jgi:hypothetical protein
MSKETPAPSATEQTRDSRNILSSVSFSCLGIGLDHPDKVLKLLLALGAVHENPEAEFMPFYVTLGKGTGSIRLQLYRAFEPKRSEYGTRIIMKMEKDEYNAMDDKIRRLESEGLLHVDGWDLQPRCATRFTVGGPNGLTFQLVKGD